MRQRTFDGFKAEEDQPDEEKRVSGFAGRCQEEPNSVASESKRRTSIDFDSVDKKKLKNFIFYIRTKTLLPKCALEIAKRKIIRPLILIGRNNSLV